MKLPRRPIPQLTPEQRADFERRIDRSKGPNACHLWIGCRTKNGYGTFFLNGKAVQAHRVAWTIANGSFPVELDILHDCPGGDNKRCCNPKHLRPGTNAENMHDKAIKGQAAKGDRAGLRRHPERCGWILHPETICRGEDHGMSKLTWAQVAEIRARYIPKNVTMTQLAKEYGVDQSLISRIINHKYWVQRDDANGV